MTAAVAERPARSALKTPPKPKPDRREAPVVEFEIERNDWCEILSDAAIFAGRDDTLPMLTCVRLQIGVGGQIVAAATNQFTLGRRTYQLETKPTSAVEVLMPVTEVDAMAKIHTARRRGVRNPLRIVVTGKLPYDKDSRSSEGGSVRVSSGGGDWREVVSTHRCMAIEFVDIDALLDSEMKREPGLPSLIGFNPEFVALFSKVSRRRGESMHVRLSTPSRPMLVTIGEHFTGLVMPARIPESAEARS